MVLNSNRIPLIVPIVATVADNVSPTNTVAEGVATLFTIVLHILFCFSCSDTWQLGFVKFKHKAVQALGQN